MELFSKFKKKKIQLYIEIYVNPYARDRRTTKDR